MAVDPTQLEQLGTRLKVVREQRGLSLEQCAEKLYVPASVVTSIEAGRLDQLGAPVFARGHLKRYGELLGMNVAELERGMLQGLAAQPDLARIVTRSAGIEEPRRSIGIKPLLIVTCALILIALIWWLLRMQPRAAEVSTTTVIPLDPPVTVTGEPAVLAPAAPQITPMAGSAASTAGGPVAVPAMSPTRAKPARAPAVTPRRRPARAPPVTEPAPEPEPAPAPVSETRSDRTDVN